MMKAVMERVLYEVEHYIPHIEDRTFLRIVAAALYRLARDADDRAANLPDVIVPEPENTGVDISDMGVVTEVIQ